MCTLNINNARLTVDYEKGHISSLMIDNKERISEHIPLFRIRTRDRMGTETVFDTYTYNECKIAENGNKAEYRFVVNGHSFAVSASVYEQDGEAIWGISISPADSDVFVEWVDFPLVNLPKLKENTNSDAGGKILLPYNEGVIISDAFQRDNTGLDFNDPEYPSLGSYYIFPNMMSSQMISYLWNSCGLYFGAHDPTRGVKGIDFVPTNMGITLRLRHFCGVNFGDAYSTDYPIVWSVINGTWESAAERYRSWFELNLPDGVVKIRDNKTLPDWYEESPLVISYPVRGIHDQDIMSPNELYPYTNALPIIREIKEQINNRILVLLMHWEGTAPWAPPFVWPPFGDEDNFNEFKSKLHTQKDMLGVYCSGFGYTLKSNLIDGYDRSNEYTANGYSKGMCTGPDGNVSISKICTGQRSGYDICPASQMGRSILNDAYDPLFKADLDYVQILDQNHGGGQYFCYSKDHGHPPAPGKWMTKNMQAMLSSWTKKAENTLFGCESAAAEPFIGNLLFSDNRFEINYKIGEPVPFYAYVYHEYVRNFMGNQVSCPFNTAEDTIRFRIAYSFAAGDSLTIVLTPDGKIMSHWGMKDFSAFPDKEKALTLIANLTRFYKEKAKKYLYNGKMIPSLKVNCEHIPFKKRRDNGTISLPNLFTSAWLSEDESRAQIIINPTDKDITCTVGKERVTVPALDAVLIDL